MKYIRYGMGIPLFSLAVTLLIADIETDTLVEALALILFSAELFAASLWLMDIPTVNVTNVNIINK